MSEVYPKDSTEAHKGTTAHDWSTATRHIEISSELSSTRHIQLEHPTFLKPRVILRSEPTLTHKAENITHVRIRTHCNPCGETASHHHSEQQFHQDTLVPFASLSAISGTFNSLFKVLFTFPSWYLFAIGLEPIFSFRWNLPPNLRSNPEERDS